MSGSSANGLLYSKFSSHNLPTPEGLGYTLGKTLGSGTYAKVKAAWSPQERQMIAIKILSKRAASEEYLRKFLPREMKILRQIRHENIIQTYEIVETDRHAFFMLELAANGDLLDYINARRFLHEPEARHIFMQMGNAIAYCHALGIVHRDLKCENIMLSKDMDVKIGDFGFALNVREHMAKTPCGSYSYAAPELFNSDGDAYDGAKADVWSLGVILYAMVCGRLPFGDDSQVKKLKSRQLSFSRHVSYECRKFVCSILQVSVEERLSSSMMLFEEWPNTQPIVRPSLIQPITTKYTVEKCLPPHIAFPVCTPAPVPTSFPVAVAKDTAQKTVCAAAHSSRSKPPLVAKIGACGRKIADAVRHVGHHKSLSQHVTVTVAECSGISESAASVNQSVENHSFTL